MTRFQNICEQILQYMKAQLNLDPLYIRTDPNGSVRIRVQIVSLFALELLDPYQFGIDFSSGGIFTLIIGY